MLTARVMLLVPVLCALGGQASRPTQEPASKDARLGPAAELDAEARRERIRAEVASVGAAIGWAGRYYMGDGTGVNVTVDVAPKAGFVCTWTGCLGIYDRNYGAVAEKEGRLEFTFTFANVRQGMRGFAPVVVPIKWGERRYLVASDELRRFVNAVNGGDEPRAGVHGSFLLRSGDEARPADGRPALPAEVAGLLLAQPVTGTIVAVHESRIETSGETSWRVTEATIDRGEEHGLWQGLVVHIQGGSFRGTVIELGKSTARIRIRDWGGEKAVVPRVDWPWSTSGRSKR